MSVDFYSLYGRDMMYLVTLVYCILNVARVATPCRKYAPCEQYCRFYFNMVKLRRNKREEGGRNDNDKGKVGKQKKKVRGITCVKEIKVKLR